MTSDELQELTLQVHQYRDALGVQLRLFAAQCELQAMLEANRQRLEEGKSTAYDEDAFWGLSQKHGLMNEQFRFP